MPSQKRERQKAGRQSQKQAIAAANKRRSRQRAVITAVVILAIVALIAGATGLFSSDDGKKVASDASTTAPGSETTEAPPSTVKGAAIKGETPCPKADGSSPRTTSFEKPPPTCTDRNKTYTATMKTSQGTITLALDAKNAPTTVNNFVVLSRYHFYDGLTFHRVVPDFVIQGGDPQGDGSGGPGYKFIDEKPTAPYKTGSLAMANSGPNTNGSQFFIVTSDSGAQKLQPLYNLFGNVTEGMDAVKKIEALGDANSPNGAPKEQVVIESVTIAES